MISNICVYCGSSTGHEPAFLEAANALGATIAAHGFGLVYGGANIGLMGKVANSALASDGKVIGVIPKSLQKKEIAHTSLTELHLTQSMHERKALMADLSDAFVALPGGLGTLEELFEIWTWAQLGFHRKPLAVLNINGFYDKLIDFLREASEKGFIKAVHQDMLIVADSPKELIQKIEAFDPIVENKLE